MATPSADPGADPPRSIATPRGKLPVKARLQELITEYGQVALGIYLVISVLTYLGFYTAISAGFDVGDSTGASASTYVAAWVALKVTMPIRVGATLVLTPLIARLWRR